MQFTMKNSQNETFTIRYFEKDRSSIVTGQSLKEYTCSVFISDFEDFGADFGVYSVVFSFLSDFWC